MKLLQCFTSFNVAYSILIQHLYIALLSFVQKYNDLSLKETSPEDATEQLGHCVSVLPVNNGIFFRVKASLYPGTLYLITQYCLGERLVWMRSLGFLI